MLLGALLRDAALDVLALAVLALAVLALAVLALDVVARETVALAVLAARAVVALAVDFTGESLGAVALPATTSLKPCPARNRGTLAVSYTHLTLPTILRV